MARPRKISDEQILKAAREAFLENGPSVSTTVIAEKLGVSQAALFKRFQTKEELLIASLVPHERDRWMGRLMNGPEEGDLKQQLIEIGIESLIFFQKLVPALSILRASNIDPKKLFAHFEVPPPFRGHKILSAWFRKAQEQGRIRGSDPEALAYMLLGALQIRPFFSHISDKTVPRREIENYVTEIINILWSGLEP